MPDLNITIILPSGGARNADIPDDVAIRDLMAELASLLQLPTVGPDGRPMGYRLDSKALGRELKETETLASAGVPNNDRLMLTADITAGGVDLNQSPRMRRLRADAELMKELAKHPVGKEWLKELEKARYPWFHISTGTGWYHTHISWNDNLDVPFDNIRTNIKAIKAGRDRAWQAIADPMPGTMLTVFDELLQQAEGLSTHPSAATFSHLIEHLEEAVRSTAETLLALKAAGIVDSGQLRRGKKAKPGARFQRHPAGNAAILEGT